MALVSDLVQLALGDEPATMLGDTQSNSLSATGNNSQADALQLTASINHVTTVGATANGVKLPSAKSWKGSFVMIRNSGANALNVFPATDESINVSSANAANVIDPAVTPPPARIFFKISTTQWITR